MRRIELGIEHRGPRERDRAGAERALAGEELRDGAVQLGAARVELRGDGDGAGVELRAADHRLEQRRRAARSFDAETAASSGRAPRGSASLSARSSARRVNSSPVAAASVSGERGADARALLPRGGIEVRAEVRRPRRPPVALPGASRLASRASVCTSAARVSASVAWPSRSTSAVTTAGSYICASARSAPARTAGAPSSAASAASDAPSETSAFMARCEIPWSLLPVSGRSDAAASRAPSRTRPRIAWTCTCGSASASAFTYSAGATPCSWSARSASARSAVSRTRASAALAALHERVVRLLRPGAA